VSNKKQWLIFSIILLLAVALRLIGYRYLEDSLGTIDTITYLDTAKVDFPSIEFFKQVRPATIPLIYKLFRPHSGYMLDVISNPSVTGGEKLPTLQPSFVNLIICQIAMSILGWSTLALVMFHRLKQPAIKIISAISVLLFGFTPQMADWDFLLMSESLSFSLYATLIALTIELAFSLGEQVEKISWKPFLWVGFIFPLSILWTFTRDTNAYLILVSICVLIVLLIFTFWRKTIPSGPLILSLLLTCGLFFFHQTTFQASPRWLLPLLNNLTTNVFPYPSRVAFFESKGMPISPELLSLRGPAEYNGIYEYKEFIEWIKSNGFNAYTEFLIRTPIWAAQSFYRDLEFVFLLNRQWYFEDSYSGHPSWLIPLGNILHPLSSSVLLIDLLLTLLIIGMALQFHTVHNNTWAVIAVWLFISGAVLLAAGYFGEVRSVQRHALAGTVPLRLSLWLMFAIVADLSLSQK